MINDQNVLVDLYVPRKCSATSRLIKAKEHGAVQISVGMVNEQGVYTGKTETFAISGSVRQRGESDSCLNKLFCEKNLLTFDD